MHIGIPSPQERFHPILRSLIEDGKPLSGLTKDEFAIFLSDTFWDSCIRRVLYGEMKWDIGTFLKNGYYLDGTPGERDSIDRGGVDIASEGE
ncbi:MAG TPA: hypothetical protein PK765_06630 [bacterium]|nr:hypothetical protein [bacterium]